MGQQWRERSRAEDAILARSLRDFERVLGHGARLLGARDEGGRGGREGRESLSENGHTRAE